MKLDELLTEAYIAGNWETDEYTWELIYKGPITDITPEVIQRLSNKRLLAIFTDPRFKPDKDMIKTALTNIHFIMDAVAYQNFVQEHFKDNSVLMNKWLRYAENMRNMK